MPTAKARNARVWLSRISQGGQPVYFSAKTGGGRTSDSTSEYNGGSLTPEVSTAPPQTEAIVVTLRYDPSRDYAILRKLDDQVGSYTDTLNILDTDAQLNPIPGVPATVYPNAVLTGMSGIDYDANGSDSRTCQLTFAVGARAS
jgi:hypothetical protein